MRFIKRLYTQWVRRRGHKVRITNEHLTLTFGQLVHRRAPKVTLREDVAQWCKDHGIKFIAIQCHVITDHLTDMFGDPVLYFSSAKDAIAFKMRWSSECL